MKITVEVDTSDLISYHEGPGVEIPGAGKENVWQLLNTNLLCYSLYKRMRFMAEHKEQDNPALYKSMMDYYDQEEKLARRIVENCIITYEENNK